MQYFQPKPGYYVGDCMPYYHEGVFHLFYLLDEGHHQGLGGHQWAHATTRDLIHWEHQPLALPITEEWEKSICTGSVFFHEGRHHAFYAIRKEDFSQHLGRAESSDGIHFTKSWPNPFASAPVGYCPNDFRDPFIFTDEGGLFHMLVTTRLAEFPLHDAGGCLLRFTSRDLKNWEQQQPLLIPGGSGYASIPECPDLFSWNGWYYLLFGLELRSHYRISRQPFGPWSSPAVDLLGNSFCAVMKTAPFDENRRIGAAWIGDRRDQKDNGGLLWGGTAVFREVVQNPDGTLGTKFPAEMIPATGTRLTLTFRGLTPGATMNGKDAQMTAAEGQEVGVWRNVPQNYRLRCIVRAEPGTAAFGLGLRGSGAYESKYDLRVNACLGTISLGEETMPLAGGIPSGMTLDIVVSGTIIDVCIGDRQCLVNRCPKLKGADLFFFCENGAVRFEQVDLRPLL